MSKIDDLKKLEDKAAFERFTTKLGTSAEWLSIENRDPPEPDLLCQHAIDGPVAFELVRIIDRRIARNLAIAQKTAVDAFFSTADPTERILRDKLSCVYATTAGRIDLLVYVDGRVITTDCQICEQIREWSNAITHPFSNIWMYGEKEATIVWSR